MHQHTMQQVTVGVIGCVQDFCRVLSELHDKAPTHSWEESKVAIEEAFGKSVEQLFESIDHKPIASGSIAQVSLYKEYASVLFQHSP